MHLPGSILVWAAFLLVALSTVAYALAVPGNERRRLLARQAYVLATVAVIAACALLLYSLLAHDYRLHYVWAYSDNALPMSYLVSTFWAGQEGSFLFWVLCGALLGLPLIRLSKGYEDRVMLFYNLTLLWLLLLLVKQSPFRFHEGLAGNMVPPDGQGLNPLLQNPWMVIHPPVMFVGYASLAVPFAFALAALWMRRYDEWMRVCLPWVLLSLATLGAAIMLGGYWAYETLGWGGYWGWDPVENASLVPWLATAALTHGMLLQRGRNRFRRLNLILAVVAFLLVVYATFLTRSGVLSNFSVHSFVDLGITGWLIFNMCFFLVLSLGMLIWRWREIPTEVGSEPFLSRTIFLVLGIVLLILIGLVVAVGTSTPILSRLWGEPSQVGPDFYNRMGFWLAVVLVALLGVIPFLGWRKAKPGAVGKAAAVALVTALATAGSWFLGVHNVAALVYVAASVLCVAANLLSLVERARAGKLLASGAAVAHVGMGLMVLAFLTTGWYDRSEKVRLIVDQPTQVLGFSMTFKGIERPTPTARDAMVVEVGGQDGGSFELRPRMWVNPKTDQLVANPDIRSFASRDLYVAPVEYSPGEKASPAARFGLVKGQRTEFADMAFVFSSFDLTRQGEVPDAMTVGVVLEVTLPGRAPVTVEPALAVSSDGARRPLPAAIPGLSGASILTTGFNVDAGVVWVELVGLAGGVGRTAFLHKDETLTYGDYRLTFTGFDLSDFEPDAGKIHFGVIFEVEGGAERALVVPRFHADRGQQAVIPAVIPGSGGLTLSVTSVDAEQGALRLEVFDPRVVAAAGGTPASLVLDVSTKPLIALVWIGTILVVVGICMALAQRRRNGTTNQEGDAAAA